MSSDLGTNDRIEEIKAWKQFWVEAGHFNGDMPPTVMAYRKGKRIATIISGRFDPNAGLQIVAMCRKGLDIDLAYMIVDARICKEIENASSKEEAVAAFRKKFPPNSMQQLSHEQMKELGVQDVVMTNAATSDGEHYSHSLIYEYNGGGLERFSWGDESGMKDTTGRLIESLKRAMQVPTVRYDIMRQIESMKVVPMPQSDKIDYHADRGVLRAFIEDGHHVVEGDGKVIEAIKELVNKKFASKYN